MILSSSFVCLSEYALQYCLLHICFTQSVFCLCCSYVSAFGAGGRASRTLGSVCFIRLFLGSCLILGYFSLARVVMHACDEAPDVWSFPPAYSIARCDQNARSGECPCVPPVRVLGVKTDRARELRSHGSTGQDQGPRSRLALRDRLAQLLGDRPARLQRLPGLRLHPLHTTSPSFTWRTSLAPAA